MSKPIKVIDPHLHLFDLTQGKYDWLKPDNPPFWPDKSTIFKSYADNLIKLQPTFDLAGYVHIEAGFDNINGHREIANIEQRASLTQRSIGYLDITLDPSDFIIALGEQAKLSSSVGIRHILEDCEDKSVLSILENANSYTNLAYLAKRNGIFELQCDVNDRELVVKVFAFFQALPTLQIVLNHAGFAPSAFASTTDEIDSETPFQEQSQSFHDWKANIQLLSNLSNIAVKCSGFEMVARDYSTAHVEAVLAHCIDAFGIENVMLASNFPLCEFSHSYSDYWSQLFTVLERLIENKKLSAEHKKALYYDNALRIYHFANNDETGC